MKNLIVQIRQERGIRQDELAKMLGVSRQTISSLENGRYDPSILLAHKIAKLFDMSIEEVFLFEEEEK
ncbi:MAG: helix-turn-helix transcriptional regulator [Lachnospiraceae bacterium]|nr:helix-turn-helix transcriptional regulator [Lachnospiraceae bacterium]